MLLLSWIRLLRRLALQGGLAAVYLFVVAPLGWAARIRRARLLDSAGWVPLRIDSDDRDLYQDLGAAAQAGGGFARRWLRLIRAYREIAGKSSFPWKWIILAGLAPWAWAAKPPREADLSSDLYVLF